MDCSLSCITYFLVVESITSDVISGPCCGDHAAIRRRYNRSGPSGYRSKDSGLVGFFFLMFIR